MVKDLEKYTLPLGLTNVWSDDGIHGVGICRSDDLIYGMTNRQTWWGYRVGIISGNPREREVSNI